MAEKKTDSTSKHQEKLSAAAEQLKKAAELLSQLHSDAQSTAAESEPEANSAAETTAAKKPAAKKSTAKSTTAKKPAAKSTAAKSTTAKSTTAKKPAAKSTAAKSTTAKSTTAKKPATKSTAAKSTATKKPAAKKTAPKAEPEAAPVEDVVVQPEAVETPKTVEPVAEVAAVQQPAPEPVKAEEPKVEEPKAEEVKVVEQKAETPVVTEQPKAEEPKPEVQAAVTTTTTTTVVTTKKSGFATKADTYINGSGKLLFFIIVNVLFVVSAVMLLLMPFSLTVDAKGNVTTYNLFAYFTKGDAIKAVWTYMAGEWVDAGYIIMMILMIAAVLLPLVLVVKNIIVGIKRKKDFSVSIYKPDAIVFFAFMLLYMAVINLFGANVTAGMMIAFILAAVTLAFVLFTMLITKDVRSLPFFSFVNIILAMITIFVLTGPAANLPNGSSLYAANAADATFAIGYFITLIVTILLLIVLIVMQIKRLPRVIEIIVPLAAAVTAIVSLCILAPSLPLILEPAHFVGATLAPGYLIGVVLTIVIAVADTMFALLKPLQKYKNMVDDSTDGMNGYAAVEETTTTTTTTVVTSTNADATATAATTPAQPSTATTEPVAPATAQTATADANKPKICPDCKTENADDASFCKNCGYRLN